MPRLIVGRKAQQDCCSFAHSAVTIEHAGEKLIVQLVSERQQNRNGDVSETKLLFEGPMSFKITRGDAKQ